MPLLTNEERLTIVRKRKHVVQVVRDWYRSPRLGGVYLQVNQNLASAMICIRELP